jgi:hypothetical protein
MGHGNEGWDGPKARSIPVNKRQSNKVPMYMLKEDVSKRGENSGKDGKNQCKI